MIEAVEALSHDPNAMFPNATNLSEALSLRDAQSSQGFSFDSVSH